MFQCQSREPEPAIRSFQVVGIPCNSDDRSQLSVAQFQMRIRRRPDLGPTNSPQSGFRIVGTTMLSRRLMLVVPVAQAIPSANGALGTMRLSLHQYTSAGAGFRKSLEG